MNFRFPRFTLLAALFAAGAQPVAEAAEYADVNTTASTISFTYDQMGASVYGTFSRFEGSLYFDTVRPESAHARLIIELDSIDAGSSDANSELKKTAWFDTAVYPQAILSRSAPKTWATTAIRSPATSRSGANTGGGGAGSAEGGERHRHFRRSVNA
jgi:polyisoprenoid-binding protein YceI